MAATERKPRYHEGTKLHKDILGPGLKKLFNGFKDAIKETPEGRQLFVNNEDPYRHVTIDSGVWSYGFTFFYSGQKTMFLRVDRYHLEGDYLTEGLTLGITIPNGSPRHFLRCERHEADGKRRYANENKEALTRAKEMLRDFRRL